MAMTPQVVMVSSLARILRRLYEAPVIFFTTITVKDEHKKE